MWFNLSEYVSIIFYLTYQINSDYEMSVLFINHCTKATININKLASCFKLQSLPYLGCGAYF